MAQAPRSFEVVVDALGKDLGAPAVVESSRERGWELVLPDPVEALDEDALVVFLEPGLGLAEEESQHADPRVASEAFEAESSFGEEVGRRVEPFHEGARGSAEISRVANDLLEGGVTVGATHRVEPRGRPNRKDSSCLR